MSTLKGTTMHPRCRHIGETYLNVDFSSSAQIKIKVKFNFELFWRKKNWFPCCSTREDLSVDVSITYVGLILTKPGRFLFSAYGNSGYGQNCRVCVGWLKLLSYWNFIIYYLYIYFYSWVILEAWCLHVDTQSPIKGIDIEGCKIPIGSEPINKGTRGCKTT